MTLELPGPIDFAIITIKEEEFDAVLRRFPPDAQLSGLWEYNISHVQTKAGLPYRVATVRCLKQATNEAQSVTGYIIEDLDPKWILLVGIAGAIPAAEYTLGDVVVSTRIYDLNVGAHVPGQEQHYAITADSIHEDVAPVVANLRAHARDFGGWNDEASVGRPRPRFSLDDLEARLTGDERWREKVRSSITRHFGSGVPDRKPLYTAGPLASSDDLIKDPSVLQRWQTHARDIYAVEMEASGVHRGARRRGHSYPFVSIRGLSDVVGLAREHEWTEYACETAAAFTRVFTDLVAPRIAAQDPQDALHPIRPSDSGDPGRPTRTPISSRPRVQLGGSDPLIVAHNVEAREVVEEYAHRVSLDPPEAVLAVLRRLNLPWREPLDEDEQALLTETMLAPGVAYPSPAWVLRRLERVPDFLGSVADAIRSTARWPDSYRLNYVRQLSTTNLTRSLGAGHTRLAHCLGTLDVATCILAALCANNPELLSLGSPDVRAWLVATQFYAFLHDRYHGPLGHSLDPLAWLLTRAPGSDGAEAALRQLDKAELESQVRAAERRRSHPVRRMVDFVVRRIPDLYGPVDSIQVMSRLHALVQLGGRSSVPSEWRFLQDVVDGELDADRLDYIWRDAHHLSVPTEDIGVLQSILQFPAAPGVGELVDGVRVVPLQGENRLAFPTEHARTAQGLLALRFFFYVYFYEHPQKRVYDELITRTIRQALEECGSVEDGRVPAEVSHQLRTLTDQGLFHFLLETSALEDRRQNARVMHAALRMTQDVIQARPWTIVWECALDAPGLAQELVWRAERAPLVERVGMALGTEDLVAASAAAQRAVARAGRQGGLDALFAAHGVVAPHGHRYTEAAPVVDLQQSFGVTFEVLRSAEALLWARISQDPEVEHVLQRYRDTHCMELGEETPQLVVLGFVTADPPRPERVLGVGPKGAGPLAPVEGPWSAGVARQVVFHAFAAVHPGLLAAEARIAHIIRAWLGDLGYLDLAGARS
ncbi:MAG: hypothetical protein KC933_10275 [Myxococcales bacterium]|nr:hypothetical protein [Myxococcales bacterium]